MKPGRYYLIAEYCAASFFTGWHLYLRESAGKQQRNSDGGWGWIRARDDGTYGHPLRNVFDALGIDGTLSPGHGDDSAIGRFAYQYRLPRQRIGGKPRGCVEVSVDEWNRISLVKP